MDRSTFENAEIMQTGLSLKEVEEKKAKGLFNKNLNVKTKSYWQIVKGNLFSLFNLVNLILFVCILIAGSPKNGLFFLVVFWNFAIGVIQEIRAKKTIDKLSLLASVKAYALREGKVVTIDPEEIVLGDILKYTSGNQICVDCIILKGSCQVNESLITGESEPVIKNAGDHLLSGSYVIAGSVTCRCESVGADIYVNKITARAKYVKKSNSVILHSVKSVVRVVAIALIPLAGLMVWKNFFLIDNTFKDAMVATVASISAMIPGGLVLLVSLVMTVSVIRLSKHKTLAQDLFCVENLARVDVMCIDKTGTITEGNLQVQRILAADDYSEEDLRQFALLMEDSNSTISAIRTYLGVTGEQLTPAPSADQIPFSSENKWSLLKYDGSAFILGAPEKIINDIPEAFKNDIEEAMAASKRVVAFARANTEAEQELKVKDLPGERQLLAFIIISDKVRDNAASTLEYFEQENVCIKVISGDNPVTVSKVSQEAGLKQADKYIDASELDSYEKILEAIDMYTVFGRVTPYQKLDIIKALKEKGHTVAMVGDGANDVLALKEADCSVAMQAGSDAARNVSSLVLLESDFAALPSVLAEGRKTINNLQRSAGLYLTKTVYAFILTIVFLFVTFTYPFQSIQVTFIGAVTIGIPSFLLAFEPNISAAKNHFLRNVFLMSIPSGILTFTAIFAGTLVSRNILGAETGQIQTVATLIAIMVGLIVIFNICGRMNRWKWIMLAFLGILTVVAALVFGKLLSLEGLPLGAWIVVISCAVGFAIVHTVFFKLVMPKLEKLSRE